MCACVCSCHVMNRGWDSAITFPLVAIYKKYFNNDGEKNSQKCHIKGFFNQNKIKQNETNPQHKNNKTTAP